MSPSPAGLRSWPFLRLWLGHTASGIATWALPFILGFAASTGQLSATDLGILLALRSVGFLVAVPVGGVLADQAGRRRLIAISGAVAAAGSVIVARCIGQEGAFMLPLMCLGVVLSGLGQGASRPAYQALVPMIARKDELQTANAALGLSIRAANLAGPLAGTLLAATAGIGGAVLCVMALWLVSATLPPWPERLMPAARRVADGRRFAMRFLADLLEGVYEARRHPWFFAALAALSTVIAAGYSVTNVLLPQISHAVHGSAALLVACTTALMGGALAGSLAALRWHPQPRGWWALAGLAAYALAPASLLAAHLVWLPVIAYLCAGFGLEIFNITWFTAIQNEIAPEKLARVSALDFVTAYGVAPLGLLAIGPLAQVLGTQPVLAGAAVLCLAAPLLAWRVPSTRAFRRAVPPLS